MNVDDISVYRGEGAGKGEVFLGLPNPSSTDG